ncbi:hypothetical protein [Alkaliphilus oremlandii]|uniref:hypothetical protein n=1 Tax=Alkaliphilus oremlandii TaxID=461876 RepID=UPI0002FF8D62|nr:hypothetical protein [Alkaliphilus oremlandii]
MSENKLYDTIKTLLNFIEDESRKELNNSSYEARIWSKGYKKAMVTIRNFIWNLLNKDN